MLKTQVHTYFPPKYESKQIFACSFWGYVMISPAHCHNSDMDARNFLLHISNLKNALGKQTQLALCWKKRKFACLLSDTTIANTIWFRPESVFRSRFCVWGQFWVYDDEGGRESGVVKKRGGSEMYICVWKEREMYWFDFEVNQLRSSYIHPHTPSSPLHTSLHYSMYTYEYFN
jgi:hypothetical protein